MAAVPASLPGVPVSDKRCPERVEVDPAEQIISAAQVKAWVAHLRSHGWTEKDLGLVWLSRARQGVTR
jgi:hypothetical protein